MGSTIFIIISAAGGLFGLIIILSILAKLYTRASKEISFVRTGFGGQRVIMNGGALVFPILHEVIPVNMNTLRLEVRRINEQALITKDRMRVDVQAEFYVRVKPTAESIANAAQTLGQRTMDPKALKDLVEGKFVDSLRAVAAEMAIEELHEQRVDFVQKVQTAVSEDLLKNGLELETVSLTALDQTDQKNFNARNIFDAQGLTKLTEEIQAKAKIRNDIEKDTELEIKKKNLAARQASLKLQKEEKYAELEQQREVEIRESEQKSTIAKEKSEKEKEAKEVEIETMRQVKYKELEARQSLEEQRIENEKKIKTKEIERAKIIENQKIERDKNLNIAEQEKSIAVAEKSKENSVAQSEANKAKAQAVKSEEAVQTARETEIAERKKAIELVEAKKQAEKDAIGITIAAEAEKQAAIDKQEALKTESLGEAEKIKIISQAEAEATKLKAEAEKLKYQTEAAGKEALNRAENLLSPEVIAMKIKSELIKNLDKIIKESVKPLENIEGIKIVQMNGGITGGYPSCEDGAGSGFSDQVVNSALRYRSQAPIVDALMKEVGISGESLESLTKPFIESDNADSDSKQNSKQNSKKVNDQ